MIAACARASLFFLFLIFSAFALLATALPCTRAPMSPVTEQYDPGLGQIQSIDQAENYIRATLPPDATAWDQARAVQAFAARRFVHGYSNYSLCSNWLAYIAGGGLYDLKVPIVPDDILRHRRAMCVQNAIVVMALLERFDIPFASVRVGADQHMAAAASIDGRWLLLDGDLEPVSARPLDLDAASAPLVRQAYAARTSLGIDTRMAKIPALMANSIQNGDIRLGEANVLPGTRGRLFQQISGFLSAYGWAVLLMAFLWSLNIRPRFARGWQPGLRATPLPA